MSICERAARQREEGGCDAEIGSESDGGEKEVGGEMGEHHGVEKSPATGEHRGGKKGQCLDNPDGGEQPGHYRRGGVMAIDQPETDEGLNYEAAGEGVEPE